VKCDRKGLEFPFFFFMTLLWPLIRGTLINAVVAGLLILPFPSSSRAETTSRSITGQSPVLEERLCLVSEVTEYQLKETYLVPGSLRLSLHGNELREGEDFDVVCPAGIVHLLFKPAKAETLKATYSRYSLSIPAAYRSYIEVAGLDEQDPGPPGPFNRRRGDGAHGARPSNMYPMSISGSKGLSIEKGSGGEFRMDQSLDLSVNGTLPGGTSVTLQLSDQSVPVSAAGSSVELRKLDNVSFHVANGPVSATLGDYNYSLDGFEFARIDRKLEGVRGEWRGKGLSISGAGAITPGKFASCSISGVEGKQGPYRLVIDGVKDDGGWIVLANSERVYLDGVLMKRGEGGDYTIDYNEGTITFTGTRLISVDSRIEVDFEYGTRGGQGSFYSTTFQSSPGGLPLDLKGYFITESDRSDSTAPGSPIIGGSGDNRVGLAYSYRADSGLHMEGEGAYQSGHSSLSDMNLAGRPAGAFSLSGGVKDISLFDRDGGRDRWSLSLLEKVIQSDFSYPGRRYAPDFRWKWGLSPDPGGREDWTSMGLGFGVSKALDLSIEMGRIRRGNGEYAFRERMTGTLTNDSGSYDIEGELFSIHAMRRQTSPSGSSGPSPAEINGRSVVARRRWGVWVPSVAYTHREEVSYGGDGWGSSYDEVKPSIQGVIAGALRANLGFNVREDSKLDLDRVAWKRDARLVQGNLGLDYSRRAGWQVRGSTEFRRRQTFGSGDRPVTTILGRGEFLTSGLDQVYSSSIIYELSSTSNVLQRAVFVPEQGDEGDYLADGTYVGPGNGTHVRQTVSGTDGDGRVLGASLTGVESLDFGPLLDGKGLPVSSLTHTSTISIDHRRIGDDRWRVYLFLPSRPGGEATDLYRSIQYLGEFEAGLGEDDNWTAGLDVEYQGTLDRRYENMVQDFMQRKTRFRIDGSPGKGFDVEVEGTLRRRSDGGSSGYPTDLRERQVGGEMGLTTARRLRYSLALKFGEKRDVLSGSRLHNGSIVPGLAVFFDGGGNLKLEYRMERVWDDTPMIPVPIAMTVGGDVGTTHRYSIRANWRIKGALDLTASFEGKKRPGRPFFENTGQTEFTYRF